MRATPRVRSRSGGALLLALAGCALLPQAVAAKPAVKIKKVGLPPAAEVMAGSSFKLAAKVKNRSQRATRPKVTVRLHSALKGKGRKAASRRLSKLKSGRSRNLKLTVRVPASMSAGRRYVTVCVKARRTTTCKLAGRRVRIGRPPTTPPNPEPEPEPGPEPAAGARPALRRARPHRVPLDRGRRRDGGRRRGDQGGRPGRRVQGRRGAGLPRRVHRGQPHELPHRGLPQHFGRRPQRQRAERVRGLLQAGRRLPRDRLGDQRGAGLGVHDQPPRNARRGREVGAGCGHDQGGGPRSRRQQVAAGAFRPRGLLLQHHERRPGPPARPGHGRRGHLRGERRQRRRR